MDTECGSYLYYDPKGAAGIEDVADLQYLLGDFLDVDLSCHRVRRGRGSHRGIASAVPKSAAAKLLYCTVLCTLVLYASVRHIEIVILYIANPEILCSPDLSFPQRTRIVVDFGAISHRSPIVVTQDVMQRLGPDVISTGYRRLVKKDRSGVRTSVLRNTPVPSLLRHAHSTSVKYYPFSTNITSSAVSHKRLLSNNPTPLPSHAARMHLPPRPQCPRILS